MTNKRGGLPLNQRTRTDQLHGSVEGLRRPPGPDPMARIPGTLAGASASGPTAAEAATYRSPGTDTDPGPAHVWVIHPDASDGHVAGLLVEWRRQDQHGWEARVVHRDLVDGRWVTVQEWLPAERVQPV